MCVRGSPLQKQSRTQTLEWLKLTLFIKLSFKAHIARGWSMGWGVNFLLGWKGWLNVSDFLGVGVRR